MKQIRVLDNFGNEYIYPVEQQVAEVSIGRSQSNDIILGSKTVSRHHAILKIMGDRIVLENRSASGLSETANSARVSTPRSTCTGCASSRRTASRLRRVRRRPTRSAARRGSAPGLPRRSRDSTRDLLRGETLGRPSSSAGPHRARNRRSPLHNSSNPVRRAPRRRRSRGNSLARLGRSVRRMWIDSESAICARPSPRTSGGFWAASRRGPSAKSPA